MRAAMGFLVQPPAWVFDPSRRVGDRYFQWEPVTDRVRVALGEGCVAAVVTGDGGSVVLNAKAPGFGTIFRDECASFGAPVEALIDCGAGPDEAGGNPAFAGACRVIAHERCASRLEHAASDFDGALASIRDRVELNGDRYPQKVRDALAEAGPIDPSSLTPTETLSGDGEIEIVGVEFQYLEAPGAHADGDMAVYLPDDNVLFMGDLLFSGMHPVIDADHGGTTSGWQRALLKCINVCDSETVVVSGHGVTTLLGHHALREQYNYFNWLRRMAQEGADAGLDRESVIEQVPPPEPYPWSRLYKYAVGVAYDEVTRS